RSTYAEADLRTLRHDVFAATRRRTSRPLRLIEEDRELRPRPFESGRIDVGDIIGDDFDIELLGTHAGRSDRESSHKYDSSNGHAADFQIRGNDLVADRDPALQSLLGGHD